MDRNKKATTRLFLSMMFLVFSAILLGGVVNAEGLSVTGNIHFNSTLPGETVYSDWVTLHNDFDGNTPMALYISGTDFYDSTSSGAICPYSNVLELSNLEYYAENGEYNTLSDPRADDEGYIPINYGDYGVPNTPFSYYGSYELIQTPGFIFSPDAPTFYPANALFNNSSDVRIKFRLKLPAPCTGQFDTGGVSIWGVREGGLWDNEFLSLQEKVDEFINVSIISDVIYLDENGKIISPFIYYYSGLPITYLYEGERVIFDARVYTPNGIRKVDDTYVTIGVTPGTGNDFSSLCYRTSPWDDYQELQADYHCAYEVSSPQYDWGQYQIGVEAMLLSGLSNYDGLGLYYLNYEGECIYDSDCDDSNPQTIDKCVNPAMHYSSCTHDLLPKYTSLNILRKLRA